MVHKIGIDYHGVITHQPSFWKFMLGCVIGSGGEVHIITGGTLLGDENPIINQLREWEIPYTEIHSVYDYLQSSEAPTLEGIRYFPDGTTQQKYADETWDVVKAEMCRKLNVDIHIDDTEVYGKYFTDIPFLFYKK